MATCVGGRKSEKMEEEKDRILNDYFAEFN